MGNTHSHISIKRHKTHGFTIVEIALVLAIAAVLLTLALSVGASRIEAARMKSTQERISLIIQAIEQYADRFGHLPCPADPESTFDDPDLGIGKGSGSGLCTSLHTMSGAGNLVAGSVPVFQLKLTQTLLNDAWDRRFTYVVDRDLTRAGGGSIAGYLDKTTQGNIEIRSKAGGGTLATNEGAFVLISHGSNGHGAWPGKGGATRIDLGLADSTDEGENCHVQAPGGFDKDFVQRFGDADFDDIVSYRTKWQLQE